MSIKLGDVVKDSITGFKGVAIGISKYLNGCVAIWIRPQKLKDGKMLEAKWLDEPQLVVVKSAKKKKLAPSGGPHDEPIRPSPERSMDRN